MTEGSERFARQLDKAADNIGDIPQHELHALLRRAAIRLRNTDRPAVTLDDEYRSLIDAMNANFGDLGLELDDALSSVAAEVKEPKAELIRRILREWLEANAYLPVMRVLDEDSETDGAA
jgi:hypothetical protein